MIVYILSKRCLKNYSYFNLEIIKLTRSERVKDAWIKKPGNLFTRVNMR